MGGRRRGLLYNWAKYETARGSPMFVGRIIGRILVLIAVGIAGHEILTYVDGEDYRFIALGELWYKIAPASLNMLQAGIQRNLSPWLWEAVVTPVLLWPAWSVTGLPGLILMWLFRGQRRRR
jgi:hypothetical protein